MYTDGCYETAYNAVDYGWYIQLAAINAVSFTTMTDL